MVDAFGIFLIWVAGIILPPLITLPLAWHLNGEKRSRMAAIWILLTVGFVTAGLTFSHFAVDLPKVALTFGLFEWLIAMTAFMAGIIFARTPARSVRVFSSAFKTITRTTGRAAMWLVFTMALVQFTSVILRYVFGINFIWVQESITYMHGAVFLLAGGYALLTDDHVRVDIFYRDAPPRRKAWVDFLGTYFFLFPFCLLLLWTATPYVGNAWAVREGSTEQSGIQGVFLLKTLIPIFALLLAMAGFVIAARAVETLKGRDA